MTSHAGTTLTEIGLAGWVCEYTLDIKWMHGIDSRQFTYGTSSINASFGVLSIAGDDDIACEEPTGRPTRSSRLNFRPDTKLRKGASVGRRDEALCVSPERKGMAGSCAFTTGLIHSVISKCSFLHKSLPIICMNWRKGTIFENNRIAAVLPDPGGPVRTINRNEGPPGDGTFFKMLARDNNNLSSLVFCPERHNSAWWIESASLLYYI